MTRITSWLCSLADRAPGRSPYPIRLTPGQYAELCAEQSSQVDTFKTSLGWHPVERIECHTRATGDNVILCPREDLFSEVDRGTGIELVSLQNSVTSVPENVACVEVVSVGECVSNVKPGDLAFMDLFDVRQGYVIKSEELYVAAAHTFRALFDADKQQILPLENYVVLRHNRDRFKVALMGTDRLQALEYTLSEGIVSSRASDGTPATHTLYAEVAHIGKLTGRIRAGLMTRVERWAIDCLVSGDFLVNPIVEALQAEREQGRESDIAVGELVTFTRELATKVRVRGETQYLLAYENVLAAIDDEAILSDAIRRNAAGKLVRVA
jgi:hypothetical protein